MFYSLQLDFVKAFVLLSVSSGVVTIDATKHLRAYKKKSEKGNVTTSLTAKYNTRRAINSIL
jgi:hypothetical protein